MVSNSCNKGIWDIFAHLFLLWYIAAVERCDDRKTSVVTRDCNFDPVRVRGLVYLGNSVTLSTNLSIQIFSVSWKLEIRTTYSRRKQKDLLMLDVSFGVTINIGSSLTQSSRVFIASLVVPVTNII